MTRVLVTGATGFLGGHVLRAVAAAPGLEAVAACRTPSKLPAGWEGETRVGDITDAGYRSAVVKDVDVVCHAASTASMWGHAAAEDRAYLRPTIDLGEQAVAAGARRFIMAGTVVMGAPATASGPAADDAPMRRPPRFWPHLDRLVQVDQWMRANAGATSMVMLRLGHFAGPGNTLGLGPALLPRLKTRLVPWIDRGRRRVPLVAGEDMGRAFALAATAEGLAPYESFNICGPSFPTQREVITAMAARASVPAPRLSVPFALAFGAGRFMEALPPWLPGRSPFLTRSIVHLCDDWWCPSDKARDALGYAPEVPWETAVAAQVDELVAAGLPWPRLSQHP